MQNVFIGAAGKMTTQYVYARIQPVIIWNS